MDLPGVGPFVSKRLINWIEQPPNVPDPEPLRQGFMTMTEARRILSGSDISVKGLRGDLQMHSTWSDGDAEISELAAEGARRGYDYIAVTDHSKGLKIAGGLDEDELEHQLREIDRVNAELTGARVLKSLEMNLSPQGEGDMHEDSLSRLEIVLGAFHSKLRIKEDQTDRYLNALKNPDIQILAHPRGRIYNFRAGLTADWDAVFATAAELDKAVEIDCFPDRQDLNVALVEKVRRAGARISIGTDTHYLPQLGYIEIGLASAVAAGVPRSKILNLMSAAELLEWSTSLKARR
jgi:histidinol phosphatase-like PHP family hydrolase